MKKYKKIILLLVGLTAVVGVSAVWASLFEVQLKPSKSLSSLMAKIYPTPTPLPEPTIENLEAMVVPAEGYEVKLNWGETGKKLVEAGGIDMAKYQENYSGSNYEDLLEYLTENKDGGIIINKENAYFWVNTLWALGLTQNSKVLSEGIMGTEYKDRLGNFASTGGWTLGAREAVSLYSSSNIIDLDADEQEMVRKISANIYRPCCGNPTSFPDCNHGMAILGLVELMVDQGFSEEEIYETSLAFNSYWFPQTYVDLAYYFQTKENKLWKEVDAKELLSAQYSSSPGYQAIKKEMGNIPGTKSGGGSCGA
jgi:hypothetical protein